MGGQTFYVGGSGGYDDIDVDKEIDASEVNSHVSESSKLSTGARIFRGLEGPEILVFSVIILV